MRALNRDNHLCSHPPHAASPISSFTHRPFPLFPSVPPLFLYFPPVSPPASPPPSFPPSPYPPFSSFPCFSSDLVSHISVAWNPSTPGYGT